MTHSSCMTAEAKFFRVSKLRDLCETEQVAAVCYRRRGGDIEFLLVQTGGGRWIFPKGGVEPGLTHAQAAAIEAFEEAGVHGRIEEAPFARYRVRRPGKRSSGKQTVIAHLCEVLRLGAPQETGRNRTWFSTAEAKRCLQDDRRSEDAAELLRVIRRAAARIKPSRNEARPVAASPVPDFRTQKDPLQQVQFEASATGQQDGQVHALYMRYIRRLRGPDLGLTDRDYAASHLRKPVPQLGGASATFTAIQNVTAIDEVGRRGKARK